jgi:hypothetical protein
MSIHARSYTGQNLLFDLKQLCYAEVHLQSMFCNIGMGHDAVLIIFFPTWETVLCCTAELQAPICF